MRGMTAGLQLWSHKTPLSILPKGVSFAKTLRGWVICEVSARLFFFV